MMTTAPDRTIEPVLLPTPFYACQLAVNELHAWGDWNGYIKAGAYSDMELEYFAIRSSCGVFDLSPMNKYRITGPDAQAYLNRLLTRDVCKIREGRVGYAVWCDEQGQVMDDGTLFHLGANDYRLCAYSRALDWLSWSALGFDVTIVDETDQVAALALQGPTSCSALKTLGLDDVDTMKPFDLRHYAFDGEPMLVSRTGFTGDLGYEVWVAPDKAEALWQALFTQAKHYMLKPIGTDALDIARIETGFLQAGEDFVPAEHAVRQGCTRSPFELGLDWLVDFSKPVFNGRRALMREREKGSRYRFAILNVEGNKPAHHSYILHNGKPVGTVTSAGWCPTAKTNIAFAQLEMPHGAVGEQLVAEIYYQRELRWNKVMAPCTVIKGAPFNPARRRQTPAPAL